MCFNRNRQTKDKKLTENNDSYDKLFVIIKDLSNNSEKLE